MSGGMRQGDVPMSGGETQDDVPMGGTGQGSGAPAQVRTRVKVCGITREADLQAAVHAGADAIGLVFYPPSRRCLTPSAAARLRRGVPAFMTTVTLFVNPSRDAVQAVIDAARPDLLQFHGEEAPDFCLGFGLPYLRGFRVGAPGHDTPQALAAQCARHADAAAWLFDSYSAGYGGSGTSFDAAMLREVVALPGARPLVLAGGLTPDNVAARIAAAHPYAVDVSSGVEQAPGLKDAAKIHAFLQAVRAADGQVQAK